MAIVSLSKAAELTGKSKSTLDSDLKKGTLKATKDDKNVWQIDTDDLFALYPEKEQQKCERLENELAECQAQIKSLTAKFEAEILELQTKLENEVRKSEQVEKDLLPKGKSIKITYNENIGKSHPYKNRECHIQPLLDFIEASNLADNRDVLLMFRRVIGSFVSQRDKYNQTKKRYSNLKDFEYVIKDQGFYDYMMFGNYHWLNLSDTHIQNYFRSVFYEDFADSSLYEYHE